MYCVKERKLHYVENGGCPWLNRTIDLASTTLFHELLFDTPIEISFVITLFIMSCDKLVWNEYYNHIKYIAKHYRQRLKSPASRLFTQSFIQTQIKENIKAPHHWPLCGEFTGNRWIPRTNGQLRGKCFHLMTSSWYIHISDSDIEHIKCLSISLIGTLLALGQSYDFPSASEITLKDVSKWIISIQLERQHNYGKPYAYPWSIPTTKEKPPIIIHGVCI